VDLRLASQQLRLRTGVPVSVHHSMYVRARPPSKFPGCGANMYVRARREASNTERGGGVRAPSCLVRAPLVRRRRPAAALTHAVVPQDHRPGGRATRRHPGRRLRLARCRVRPIIESKSARQVARTHDPDARRRSPRHKEASKHAHRTGRWMVHAFAWMIEAGASFSFTRGRLATLHCTRSRQPAGSKGGRRRRRPTPRHGIHPLG